MTIIIGAGPEPAAPNPLPTPEVDLPHPASVPAARRLLDDDQIIALLDHDHALVRDFAVEQASQSPNAAVLDALATRLTDEDEGIAVQAVSILDREKHEAATDALLDAFATSTGGRTVALAGALSSMAPDRLLEAVQAKGRLDDRAYASVASALAITGTEPVRAFLDKAMNRSGALKPGRRGALYTAVLLSGDPALTTRVLTKAIDDSKQEEPEDSSFPSRAALGTVAGLPIGVTRSDAGEEVFKRTRAMIENDVRPALSGDDAAALDEALRKDAPGDILKALSPVVTLPIAEGDHASVAKRRQGLLDALVARADAIGQLDTKAGALFLAVAARAASVAVIDSLDEATSNGMQALAKALESEATDLSALSEDGWTERFEGRSPRDIRRLVTIIVREDFHRPDTVEQMSRALLRSNHGRALLDAVGEIKEDTGIHQLVVQAMAERREEAEAVVVEVLTETPLPEDVVALALLLGTQVRTERVAVALGRRFFDLRGMARSLTAELAIRVADPRLLPLLESRAFVDEPERLAWVILSLACGNESEALTEAVQAMEADVQEPEDGQDNDRAEGLEVLLRCEVCDETLRYRFERAYVDAEAKDEMGDPAFVGEMRCKACGAVDRLKPTKATASILTQHMLEFLQAAQQGIPPERPPLVSPARTQVGGKSMGLAAALRALDEEVKDRPESIRTRLHRARTRMILKRSGVEEDLDAVRSVETDAVEADALQAAMAMRDRNFDKAAELAIRAIKRLKQEPEPRLYDAEDVDELRDNLEGYLLELSDLGAPVPDDVDLSRARKTRERMLADYRLEQEARRADQRAAEPEPVAANAPDGSSEFKGVGRNDPCPCGSGKKFKRCHGK